MLTLKEDELKAQINVDGQQVVMSVSEGVIYTDGDFDGNIDMSIDLSPKVSAETLVAHLRARVPGDTASLEVIGSEETGSGVDVTFYSPKLRGAASVPGTVTLDWGAGGGEALVLQL